MSTHTKTQHDKIENIINELAEMQLVTDVKRSDKNQTWFSKEKDYLNLIGGIVVAIDVNQNIVFINKKGCSMLGCGENDSYIGKNWFDNFVPEKVRAETRKCFCEIISGKIKNFEYYENSILTRKGKEKIIVWHNSLLLDEEKKPIGTLSTGLDVTDQMATHRNLLKSQEELKKSEERHRAIVESQEEFLCRFLPDLTFTFVNPAICRYVNKRPEDLFGHKLTEFIDQEDRKRVERLIFSISSEKPCETHEERITGADGSERWVEWVNRAIFNSHGEIVEYQSVGRDVTKRRMAEEQLREKEKFLSDIFRSIQDGICILDRELNITQVNQAMERWYAHAMPLVGKKCYEAYHGAKKPCKICPTREVFETGNAQCEIVPFRGPNQEIMGWYDLYAFPLMDESTGELKGVIEYVRDATDRKRFEEETRTLNRELIKTNRKLLRQALKDPQTGLYNHRYFEDILESEFFRAKRHTQPLSLIMMDIDYFKSFNDVYGHRFGDLILRQFAKSLRRLVRLHDYVVRYGGEEFLVVSPGVDSVGATALAERIMNYMRLHNFGDDKNLVKVRLSMAVVSYPEDMAYNNMDMVAIADKILTRIKESGGDKIGKATDSQVKNIDKNKEPDVIHLKKKLHRLTKRANQTLIESIYAFAKTIELKDHFTGDHVERTVYYATETAKGLDLNEQEMLLIEQAAILHDLGKIGISDKILLKKGKLTDKEFELIKDHPKIGADIIRPIQFLKNLIPLILYHHERWDGKGYPIGLKGEEIPLGARVIAIADVYQALTSDRPYRKAFSKQKAIDIITESSGTQFDPTIVKIFLKTII